VKETHLSRSGEASMKEPAKGFAPQMMKTYSHVQRLALDQAAAALEPTIYPSSKSGDELVN